jgi:hypothetical protein
MHSQGRTLQVSSQHQSVSIATYLSQTPRSHGPVHAITCMHARAPVVNASDISTCSSSSRALSLSTWRGVESLPPNSTLSSHAQPRPHAASRLSASVGQYSNQRTDALELLTVRIEKSWSGGEIKQVCYSLHGYNSRVFSRIILFPNYFTSRWI